MANSRPYEQDKPVEDMNIHEKRRYARFIGVKAPTRVSLAELDEAIRLREIEIGALPSIVGVYEMRPSEREELMYFTNATSRVSRSRTGYFCAFPEGDGVLRYEIFNKLYEQDIYVSKKMAQEYGLRNGDLVCGDIITVIYNKTNILRSVKYINEQAAKNLSERRAFTDIFKTAPNQAVRLSQSNPVIGLMSSLLCVGEGQSVSVFCDDDTAQNVSSDLIVSLYRLFAGQIFCIYDKSLSEAIKTVKNPFAFTPDDDDENVFMLISRLQRLVELGENAAVVAYTKKENVIDAFRHIAGNYGDGSITVFICGPAVCDTEAVVTIRGGKVILSETQNKHFECIASSERIKKFRKIKNSLHDSFPCELLEDFNGKMNKEK